MRNLLRALFSAFCVVNMSLPASAFASPAEDLSDPVDEQAERPSDSADYQLAFLAGDFGLRPVSGEATTPLGALLLFISAPDGKIVRDAQVVTTVIDQSGRQQMGRARPYKCGYQVAIDHLPAGRYRLEAEIVTAGRLLTDEFQFQKA